MRLIASVLVALLATLLLIRALKPLAKRLGWMDMPGGRKHHAKPVPLVGGIAIIGGSIFAMLTLPISLLHYRSLLAAIAILSMVGLLDDLHELNAKSRLIAQLIAASLMVFWGHNTLWNLGDLFAQGSIHLKGLAIPITLFATVTLMNAYNMLDGLDGLTGGISFCQLLFFIGFAAYTERIDDVFFLSVIAASLLGFLFFNFPIGNRKASVFMGDAGSMVMGAITSWFAIQLTQGAHKACHPVTMLWLFVVPLFDILATVIRRLSQRRSPLQPDRGHMHHRLLGLGLLAKHSSYLLIMLTLLSATLGLLLDYFQVNMLFSFALFCSFFIGYYCWSTKDSKR